MTALLSVPLLAGCATARLEPAQMAQPAGPSEPLTVTGVGVSPKTLRAPGEVTIRYRLSTPAAVRIDLVGEAGDLIRELEPGQQDAGPQEVVWDGRRSDGLEVEGGVYRYIIHAGDAGGRRVVADASPTSGGEEIIPNEFEFDRATGTLRWMMPRAGRARLRVGIEGFPHLRTLLDWEPLEAGPQSVTWDGMDASGLIRLKEHLNLTVKLTLFALGDNTIIVQGAPASGSALPQGPAGYPPEQYAGTAYLHARHPRAVCHETRVSIEFPDGTRRDDEGRPILAGTVPVRVVLDPRDAPNLVNSRFEVALYEDLTFLFEEEESINPFTFLWDTARLAPGVHLLTVNILSYDDHYGVVTQAVVIEGPA